MQFYLFGNHCIAMQRNTMQYNTTLSGNAGPVQAWHFQAFSLSSVHNFEADDLLLMKC